MAVIVVADDDTDMAEFVSYSFEVAGHTVHTALDGATALELARSHRPDVVVLDHTMPGLTGVQVAEALRDDPATAGVAVIMVSGHPPDLAQGLVDRLVTKPMGPRELVKVIRDVLASRTPRDPEGRT
ncbi:response regulator transcription factor [Couchioplanes azureus]|uniref:response regulator transcription factor n=1 Tax=Couchioplanes caeruleus TaxID=56438 RepID=UPI0016711BE0|nr:response regulator [Couchioplanes caeruleus]GGQ47767.1 hypothetical protein GCM10010166_14810 [Couchioplanes caeruleus subsp. azureus]